MLKRRKTFDPTGDTQLYTPRIEAEQSLHSAASIIPAGQPQIVGQTQELSDSESESDEAVPAD